MFLFFSSSFPLEGTWNIRDKRRIIVFSCLKFSAHQFFFSNPLLKLFHSLQKFSTGIKREGACLCCFCLRSLKCSFECNIRGRQLANLQVTSHIKEFWRDYISYFGDGKVHLRNICGILDSTPNCCKVDERISNGMNTY